MKIVQLIDTLEIGGAERMCVNIANVLSKENINNYIIIARRTGPLEQHINKNVNIYHLKKHCGLDVLALFKLIKYLKKIKPDYLHVHSTSIFWGYFVKLVTPSIKLIWHDHNGARGQKNNWTERMIILFSFLLDRVILVNNKLLEWSIKNLKVERGNLIKIDNFPYLPPVKSVKKNQPITCIMLANLRIPKDHLTVVEAMNYFKKLHDSPMLKIKFAGNYFNDEYYNTVIEKINEYNLQDYFEFLGSLENPAEELYNSHIGLLISRSEGLPVSLLEYGLAGLAVVATDVGQCKEVLNNGKCGKIISPGDYKELAIYLFELIQSPEKISTLGNDYKAYVLKNFGEENFMEQYKKLLQLSH